MSVISSSTRLSVSSRKSTSIRSVLNSTKPTKVRFQLHHTKNVRKIIIDYVRKKEVKDYENLLCLIRDSELLDEDIRLLLNEATQCISLLDQDLSLFIEAILTVDWLSYREDVIAEYQSFLINLLSAHNYHAKLVIDRLVKKFYPETETDEWPDGVPNDADCNKCINVHFVISIVLKVVPMCKELLLQAVISSYPYLRKSSHIHEYYLHNLLWILEYQPDLRRDLLKLIFSRLVLLDVHSPREEIEKHEQDMGLEDCIFNFDDDKSVYQQNLENKVKHPLAHTLDICMDKMFNFCYIEVYNTDTGELNWEKLKGLYHDIISSFDKVIFPTYNTHHVQFIIFFLCSLKPSVSEAFLNFLWGKVSSACIAPVHRQTAAAYIGSFLARANYIALGMLKGTLQQMAGWVHSYIAAQDGIDCINADVRVHTVFYSVCQAIFYVIAFRHKDLLNSKKGLTFVQSLNLAKMVTSPLNPLRVCQSAVVQNFAAVTRKYQLAYCYSIIEHNSRNKIPTIYRDEKGAVITSNNVLDSLYPFDPYLLKRSEKKIAPFYLEYNDIMEETHNRTSVNVREEHQETEMDCDDFLTDTTTNNKLNNQFSYGTSPGFKSNN
ncbi:RNA polymerase I-specific transcription initiation factor RRN3 [Agrilus planipennis]|uniref:RNA polymerase I-specific transcription initiation factor RRN3 n=1 Tax=Agrilus planipennis TaxID=224129 RepID=A0A1W4X9H0_AGRPL|nr:RNA polymerase I-specific transcription initiation factor RRN3 [Agrilus planipennis]